MMVSPDVFIEEYKGKKYKELLTVKNQLIKKIDEFEKGKKKNKFELAIDPSPEVIYQCNLEYLAELCKLISEKYNQELWGEEFYE